MNDEDDIKPFEWEKSELPEDLKFWFTWLKYELPEEELRKLFEPHMKPGQRGRPLNSLSPRTKRIRALYEEKGSPELTSQVKDEIATEVFSREFGRRPPGLKRRHNMHETIRKALFRARNTERT